MATAADYLALSKRVAVEQTNLAVAVAGCDALGSDQKDDWYDLARRCLAWTGHASLAESGAGSWDELIATGNDLWTELETWRATLTALGCDVPNLSETPAPPPKGHPATGYADLWGVPAALESALPLLLAMWVFAQWRDLRSRR